MIMQTPIPLCLIAFIAALSLPACSDVAFRVATSPKEAAEALQGPSPTWDYENMVNPATNIRTSSPYDLEDLYRDKNGFPLPGNLQIR
jgi:hypothetical protein